MRCRHRDASRGRVKGEWCDQEHRGAKRGPDVLRQGQGYSSGRGWQRAECKGEEHISIVVISLVAGHDSPVTQ